MQDWKTNQQQDAKYTPPGPDLQLACYCMVAAQLNMEILPWLEESLPQPSPSSPHNSATKDTNCLYDTGAQSGALDD